MANTTVNLFLIFLCITATQGRNFSIVNHNYDNVDGICQTMVETQGYTCEEHLVETKDGYVLSLQRLPSGRSGNKASKPPVLIQHGLFCDATIWLNSPDESLGFILADNGYDVWIGNTRGTKYSRGHRSLHPSDSAYWDWSWDELANYDLPAFVNFVYNQTGQRLHYTGHSLGTLIALAAFSQGQVLGMLRSAALLSPIAHMHQVTSPIAKVLANTFIVESLRFLGIHEFIPHGDTIAKLAEGVCKNLKLDCSKMLALFTGPNCCLNSSSINKFLDHGLQSTSTMNVIHLFQMIRTGSIAKFDYGNLLKNIYHYGHLVPPVYDIMAIPHEFPLFVGYGGQDALSEEHDVQLLLNDLRDHDPNKLVVLFTKDYAHVDYFFAVNAKQIIYDPMIAFFSVN